MANPKSGPDIMIYRIESDLTFSRTPNRKTFFFFPVKGLNPFGTKNLAERALADYSQTA